MNLNLQNYTFPHNPTNKNAFFSKKIKKIFIVCSFLASSYVLVDVNKMQKAFPLQN